MKSFYTMLKPVSVTAAAAGLFLFALLAFNFYACASGAGENIHSSANREQTEESKGETSFAFQDTEDGKDVYWKAVFRGDEISRLYRNGERIPDNEIDDYKDLVYDKMAELNGTPRVLAGRIHHFDFNDKEFNDNMKKMTEKLRHMQFNLNDSCFDSLKFNRAMEKLSRKLAKLKDLKVDVRFDSLKFNEDMKKLGEDLKNLDFNEDFAGDTPGRKWFEFHSRSGDKDFDIHIDMSRLKEKMKDLKIKMKGLDKKLESLKAFMKDVRSGLVKDGYLQNDDEDFAMDLSENGMTVNGKKLPDSLFEKYKKLYRDHFGKDLKEDQHFRIH